MIAVKVAIYPPEARVSEPERYCNKIHRPGDVQVTDH